MKDTECVRLLQWALPRLGLRWPGFRRVRGQVCKRIDRRIHTLGISGPAGYVAYLGDHPEEWAVLDGLCTVSMSRFYRDRAVFDHLGDSVLPILAQAARTEATGKISPSVRNRSREPGRNESTPCSAGPWTTCEGPSSGGTPLAS
ncbi:MAG: hypothetical protein HYY76_19320 [Acidobacteria bacterium]|nr:hypothetical protein [Acidobacteriota bacterium]